MKKLQNLEQFSSKSNSFPGYLTKIEIVGMKKWVQVACFRRQATGFGQQAIRRKKGRGGEMERGRIKNSVQLRALGVIRGRKMYYVL